MDWSQFFTKQPSLDFSTQNVLSNICWNMMFLFHPNLFPNTSNGIFASHTWSLRNYQYCTKSFKFSWYIDLKYPYFWSGTYVTWVVLGTSGSRWKPLATRNICVPKLLQPGPLSRIKSACFPAVEHSKSIESSTYLQNYFASIEAVALQLMLNGFSTLSLTVLSTPLTVYLWWIQFERRFYIFCNQLELEVRWYGMSCSSTTCNDNDANIALFGSIYDLKQGVVCRALLC